MSKVDIVGMPIMAKQIIIEELKYAILLHERWADRVTRHPQYAKDFGDYDWQMRWIEVYKNAIYYLQEG